MFSENLFPYYLEESNFFPYLSSKKPNLSQAHPYLYGYY